MGGRSGDEVGFVGKTKRSFMKGRVSEELSVKLTRGIVLKRQEKRSYGSGGGPSRRAENEGKEEAKRNTARYYVLGLQGGVGEKRGRGIAAVAHRNDERGSEGGEKPHGSGTYQKGVPLFLGGLGPRKSRRCFYHR